MVYSTTYAKFAEWGDDPEAIARIDGEIEEMYYDEGDGILAIGFNAPDDQFFSLEIPVGATEDWNEFVESLPKWEIPE